MKLTENRLRRLIRKEIQKLNEAKGEEIEITIHLKEINLVKDLVIFKHNGWFIRMDDFYGRDTTKWRAAFPDKSSAQKFLKDFQRKAKKSEAYID